MNTVRVLLFARVRELASVEFAEIDLASGATVANLRDALALKFPAVADLLPRCAIAIDGDYANDDSPIPPDAELAVIPPVSGGS